MGHCLSKFLKLTFFQSLLLLAASMAKGQVGIDQTVIPKSPDAAALDKLNTNVVQLSSGEANIAFPLYDSKSSSIELPITLSYNSGGIQTDQLPTMVGLGWSLNVGGSISRVINGNPDEGIHFNKQPRYYLCSSTQGAINDHDGPDGYDTSYAFRQKYIEYCYSKGIDYGVISVHSRTSDPMYNMAQNVGYYGGYKSPGNGGNTGLYQGGGTLYTDIQNANNDIQKAGLPKSTGDSVYTSGLIDPQPDLFTLNIPGYNGTFMFNKQGVPQLVSQDRDVKIAYTITRHETSDAIDTYFDTWIVSTPDGKQYYFGYGDNNKTYSNGGYGSRGTWITDPVVEWNLTKIVDTNTKDSIVFKYIHIPAPTPNLHHMYVLYNDSAYISTHQPLAGLLDYGTMTASIPVQICTKGETINLFTTGDTSRISASLRGNYSGRSNGTLYATKLDSIVIKDTISGNPVMRYYFNYTHSSVSARLQLASFQKISSNLVDIQPPTVFSYYDTTVSLRTFPDPSYGGTDTVGYTTLAQDHWGFYNNAQQNYRDNYYYPPSLHKTIDRSPDWPYTQMDILTQITYPSGGKIKMEYEPNSAEVFSPDIDQIAYISFDIGQVGGVRIKKIRQTDEHGKTISIHKYDYAQGYLNLPPSETQAISQPLCFVSSYDNYVKMANYNMLPRHRNTAIVSYGQVTDTEIDSLGNSNGYIVHHYYTDNNTPDTTFFSYYSYPSKSVYSLNGTGNMPAWLSHRSLGVNLLNGYEYETDYYDKTGTMQKKTTSTFGIRPDTSNNYFCGFDLFVQSLDAPCTTSPQSDYDEQGTKQLYIPPTHLYYYMQYYAEYPKTLLLTKQTTVDYTSPGGTLTNTRQFFYESPYHLNTTREIDYLNDGDTLTTVKLYAFDFADNVGGTDTICKQMKSLYYNPVIAETVFKGSQIQSGSVTNYKNFGAPRQPAIYPSMVYLHRNTALNNPANTYGAGNVPSYPVSNYFADANYVLEKTEKFAANGNLLEVQNNNDSKLAYIWGYNSRYPVAKITGSDYNSAVALVNQSTVNNSSLSDSAMQVELNKLRTGLPNAVVTTYTYRPLIGVSSEVDPADKAAFYEYDGYNRLSIVRDQNKNIVKRICYNYAGLPSNCATNQYFNPQLNQSIAGNCAAGYTSVPVIYTVPAYKYSASTIAGAIQLAQNDANTNGQSYANTHGGCLLRFYNMADTGRFLRTDCGPNTTAHGYVNYIVPAHTYSSTISQQDADQQAQNDVDANGPAYANTHGVCISTGFSFTFINANYPNDRFSHVTVTLENKTTGITYSTGSITPPNSYTFSDLPGGTYLITYQGATYTPNTGIGVFQGTATDPVYCSSSTGTTTVTIDNVELDNGQQYSLKQIAECSDGGVVVFNTAPVRPGVNKQNYPDKTELHEIFKVENICAEPQPDKRFAAIAVNEKLYE